MSKENTGQSTTRTDATKTSFCQRICLGSVRFASFILTTGHIAAIVLGLIYLDKCPVEPYIPIYVIAIGALGVTATLIGLCRDCFTEHVIIKYLLSIMSVVELAAFITGSYYIYGEYQPNFNPESGDKYCNKTLYMFSFIFVTFIYSTILLTIIIIVLLVCVLLYRNKSSHVEGRN